MAWHVLSAKEHGLEYWEATIHTGADFPVANAAESNVYTIDFLNSIPAGQTISTAMVTLTVLQGTDPSPSSHLAGSTPTQIQGTLVSQIINGLVAGNIYSLNMVGVASGGYSVELYAYIPCEAVYY